MTFVNLTTHEVNDLGGGNTYPPTGVVARVDRGTKDIYYGRTLVVTTVYSDVFGIPEARHDTLYIVSAVVLNALAGSRTDCVAPYRPIRDENGKTTGCLGFRLN